MHFSRRDFLQASVAALALPSFPFWGQSPRIELNGLSLAPFVDRLPLPALARPVGRRADPDHPGRTVPFYRLEMREARVRLHRDLPPTRIWGYDGQFPGPTFETRSGEGLLVEWENALPGRHFLPIDHTLDGAGADVPEVRTVAHLHGGRTPAHSDGYPDHWQTPGQSALYHYPNRQDAAMLWYHDHAMGINRLNIYAGLFGAWFVRDAAEDDLRLPAGDYELPLILCDRLFYQDGQLHYPTSPDPRHPWVPEVFGDALLVNGKVKPYREVEPRLYRLRILNGSNGRFYVLSFSNRMEFHLIGLDQGLMSAPLRMHEIALAPGERIDLLVDFAACAGQTPVLRSEAFDLVQFRVDGGAATMPAAMPPRLPQSLRPVARLEPAAASVTRQLSLNDYMDDQENSSLMLLNATYWKAPVTEKPMLGATEIWSFVNLSEDSHPIHLHLVRFQILDRCPFDDFEFTHTGKLRLTGTPIPAAPEEHGWKDTVRADAGMVTRIIVKFEGYAGRYVWHCHILEHEDNAMMRPYEVLEVQSSPKGEPPA